MKKIVCGTNEIEKLSKEDIAGYFERAFNNPVVKKMLNGSSSLSQASSNFEHFGNILQAYITSTGDLSDVMIETLANDFEKYSHKISQPVNTNKIDGKQIYFAEHIMPYVMSHHMNKQGLKEPLNFEQTAKILKSIQLNCTNNRFLTHSFNAALLEDIKKEGLDISKEKFKEEYAILRNVDLFQPYQTGNLLFCELSKASFGYAKYTPERLIYSLGGNMSSHDEQHTINEHFTESFQRCLQSKNLSTEQHSKVFAAGKKMIDFYFGKDIKSAIAFKANSERIYTEENNIAHAELKYALTNWLLSSQIERLCNSQNLHQLYDRFKKAVEDIKSTGSYKKMDAFVTEFASHFPNNKTFQTILKDATIKAVTKDCLNNFTQNGCADGYRIEDGKLGIDKFSVAVIPNPIEQYVQNERLMIAIEKEKYIAQAYNKELYEKKYAYEVKSGRIPKESFEEYCANNYSNTYFLTSRENGLRMENPKYTAWKKEKGYRDPNSDISKNLEKQIIDKRKRQNSSMPTQSINSFQLV